MSFAPPVKHGWIYLDNAAATPIHPDVLGCMLPYFSEIAANPTARIHICGQAAYHAVEASRSTIAQILGVAHESVVFTSSATEANNLCLTGLIGREKRRRQILFGATEHSSVATTATTLARRFPNQWTATAIPVDSNGQIDLEFLEQHLSNETLCVSIMSANNETGIIQAQLSQAATLVHNVGALLHVDAVQTFARDLFSTSTLDFDIATISAAKLYGPKGSAALIFRNPDLRARIEPLLQGGGHEFGLRASTPNVPAIVGFAKAAQLQFEQHSERAIQLAKLEEVFRKQLKDSGNVQYYGMNISRVPGIFMMSFPSMNPVLLLESCRILCATTGSACSNSSAGSRSLRAMGIGQDEVYGAIRLSFGIQNTEAEAIQAAELIRTHLTVS